MVRPASAGTDRGVQHQAAPPPLLFHINLWCQEEADFFYLVTGNWDISGGVLEDVREGKMAESSRCGSRDPPPTRSPVGPWP